MIGAEQRQEMGDGPAFQRTRQPRKASDERYVLMCLATNSTIFANMSPPFDKSGAWPL
jgi:hypothetical protein